MLALKITDQKNFTNKFSLWKEVKPFCYSVIRGKKAPLSFKIVLQFSPNKTAALLQNSAFSISPELITGLYLNLQYKNKTLLCITGTSMKTFLPGKELDHLWEQYVMDFFHRNGLSVEEV